MIMISFLAPIFTKCNQELKNLVKSYSIFKASFVEIERHFYHPNTDSINVSLFETDKRTGGPDVHFHKTKGAPIYAKAIANHLSTIRKKAWNKC